MDWEEITIDICCDLIAGYAFKSKDFGEFDTKVIRIGDITPPFVHHDSAIGVNLANYDHRKIERYKIKYNDFVLAMTGATIGKVGRYISDVPSYVNQRVLLFKSKEGYDHSFIYYTINSYVFSQYVLNHIDSESAQPNISANTISKFSFKIPANISDQRKIAGILSALDSKIENNNKINANLEAQAQALFKSWFVDFTPFKDQPFVDSELGSIPQGWKVGTLGEFFPIVTGKKDANISSKSGKYPFFSCSQNISWTNDYSFDGFAIIVAGNGDFNVKWYNGKFEAYQRTYVLIPYNPTLTSWLYYAVKYNLNMITIGARGSVIKFITKGDIQNFKVAYPQNIDKLEIVKMLGKINKDIEHNKNEVSCLAKLRDTLLPKLMSGEIKL